MSLTGVRFMQLTALDEIFTRRSKSPVLAIGQRLFFVALRNGCYMIPYVVL